MPDSTLLARSQSSDTHIYVRWQSRAATYQFRRTNAGLNNQDVLALPPRPSGLKIPGHSHSIVAGGFPEMSYVTREMPGTSLMMRRETRSRKSYGKRAQCAVMKSTVSTARNATT